MGSAEVKSAPMTARKIKRVDSRGEAWLYECDPPVAGSSDPQAHRAGPHRFVIVSAVHSARLGLFETYVFPSNEAGEWVEMIELDISKKKIADCDALMAGAGYRVIPASAEAVALSDAEDKRRTERRIASESKRTRRAS